MIPAELYQKIMESVPILAVDFVLKKDNKVFLARRKDEPAKGEWWIPGGRVLKNETLEDAVKRKAKQEIGVPVEIVRKINCYEAFFDKTPFPEVKSGVHYLAVCYLVKISENFANNFKIELDKTQSDYRWIDHLEENLHTYVKNVLNDSKVFSSQLQTH